MTGKCACETCKCDLNTMQAIVKNNQTYCSQACADGHPQGKGCGHPGCPC